MGLPDNTWMQRSWEHIGLAKFFARAGNQARADVHRRLAVEHMARAYGVVL